MCYLLVRMQPMQYDVFVIQYTYMYYKPGHVIIVRIDSIEESQYIYLYQRPLNLCYTNLFISLSIYCSGVCVCVSVNTTMLEC